MPAQQKAWLCEIAGENNDRTGRNVELQFNPETLRITHGGQIHPPVNPSKGERTTQTSGQRDVPGSTPFQNTGAGSTRLSVQVWFDVTSVMLQGDESVSDVRDTLVRVLVLMVVAGSALLGVLIWIVVGRALRPVERLRSQ